MVGERDMREVQIAAGALSAQLDNRMKEMQSMATLQAADPSQPITTTLNNLSYFTSDFDAGVARFSPQGQLLTAGEYQPMWHTWTAAPSWGVLFQS
jgi:hypothetical protein